MAVVETTIFLEIVVCSWEESSFHGSYVFARDRKRHFYGSYVLHVIGSSFELWYEYGLKWKGSSYCLTESLNFTKLPLWL